MTPAVLATMLSVGIGFLLFGGSFAAFMLEKDRRLVWTLFSIAIVFITVIPVTLAVVVSAT
ncbi:hypothetical protein [Corynebacterium sp. HS2168-gen11]|uniref:hypothetical protein n=1 Tax=Corynebacterium sp. HS2168-gen11 TaxID=2974027 RepID=UPI00216AE0B9|nr:hypothetical protein [Corynebacterium sp. HS2168-gen11]MCS4536461.1 hypothetical protein [Corynebacterium sp. HS2168-gen11]